MDLQLFGVTIFEINHCHLSLHNVVGLIGSLRIKVIDILVSVLKNALYICVTKERVFTGFLSQVRRSAC